jgi:hypothetical protein
MSHWPEYKTLVFNTHNCYIHPLRQQNTTDSGSQTPERFSALENMVSLPPTNSPRVIEASYNWADPDTSARQLINTLFPQWENSDGTVEVKQLTEGTTNKVFARPSLSSHVSGVRLLRSRLIVRLSVAVQSRKKVQRSFKRSKRRSGGPIAHLRGRHRCSSRPRE